MEGPSSSKDEQGSSSIPPASTIKKKKKKLTGSEKHRRKMAKQLEHLGQDEWFWPGGDRPSRVNPHDKRRGQCLGQGLLTMMMKSSRAPSK